MKITKTTLLFIATLFFLALPMMLGSGNVQAAVYNGDGAVHNGTTGLWEVPSDAATCTGAVETDPVDSDAHLIDLSTIPTGEKCSTVEPAWVRADFTDQATCEGKGYQWGGSCSGNASGTHPHTEADCIAAGGTWTAFCQNFYTDNPAYAAERTAHECLFCHNGAHGSNRSGYLKGGHKNMSRMADGMPWAGSIENGINGVPQIYPGYDWTTAAAGYTNANGAVPGSGSSVSGTGKALYWIYDGWIGASPRAISDAGLGVCSDSTYKNQTDCETNGETWNANQPVSSYSCGRCHTTGWSAGAVDPTREPETSFPGINNIVNLSAADDSGTMQPSSSWDHFGILCSRCHNAVDGGHANSGPAADNMDPVLPAGGPSQNAKCYNCHRQVDGNNLPLDAATLKIGEELIIKNSHGALGITSHANGYLNSPHARFSGTYGQLGDSSMYDSHFITYDGGCAACHNVHDSLTDTAAGGEPWNNECGLNCHSQDPATDPYAKPLQEINHPNGVGTPLENATAADPVSACQTCHMPGGIHLFRISTDPAYRTFPAALEGQPVPTVPNSNGFPEAFVDLNMACGQCHGGDSTTTANGAPYYTVDQLVQYAEAMHGGTVATGGKLFAWTNDSTTPWKVNFVVTGAACPQGGCSYSWDFGDTTTGSGPTVSRTYADSTTAVTVTLTVDGGTTSAQVVTPTDIHHGPTCTDGSGNPLSSLSVTQANVGDTITLTQGATNGTDATPGVYVNWGDGSPMSTGSLTDPYTHSYIWNNSARGYTVTEIVQDDQGFSCIQKFNIKIGTTAVGGSSVAVDASGTGASWITNADCTDYETPAPCCTAATAGTCGDTAITSAITFYVKDASGFTKATGSVALGGSASTDAILPNDLTGYTVTFYYPTGHTCQPTASATDVTHGTADVVSGSASVSDCY